MFETIHAFLVSMLLWHLTWGWKQLLLNFVLLTILFKYLAKLSITRSFLLSLSSHITVSAVFCISVIGICVYSAGFTFDQTQQNSYIYVYKTPFICSLMFGLLYALLQIIFVICINKYYKFRRFKA